MQVSVPLFPEQASSVALEVDGLYFLCIAITAFFTILVAGLVVFFAVKYRRRSELDVPPETEENPLLEIAWIVIPLAISLVIFVWGAKIFITLATPPKEAMDIYVTGKQWMWKLQHVDGRREMNELHVPVGRPVRLIMTSEDVIHSFFIPAFRIKGDVLPGNYTKTWFQATKAGTYHLFCAEYCGTRHSNMIGKIVVMEQTDFEAWLNGGKDDSLAATGEQLFKSLACTSCHSANSQTRGPNLEGIFGKQVQLQDGSSVLVDENYLRESIVNPNAKIRMGFAPNMPTFRGVIGEDQVLQLVAYLKTFGVSKPDPKVPAPTQTVTSTPQLSQTKPAEPKTPAKPQTTGDQTKPLAPAR